MVRSDEYLFLFGAKARLGNVVRARSSCAGFRGHYELGEKQKAKDCWKARVEERPLAKLPGGARLVDRCRVQGFETFGVRGDLPHKPSNANSQLDLENRPVVERPCSESQAQWSWGSM